MLKIELRFITETSILTTFDCLEVPWSCVSPPEGAMCTTGNTQK